MKKIVDNFDLLVKVLFEQPMNKDEFYFAQVLVRGKDGNHVSGNNKNRLVRYYTWYNKEEMISCKPEIVALCRLHNARAYVSPVKRNDKEVANVALELATKDYISANYVGFRSIYPTACGKSYVTADKKFVVDHDSKDIEKLQEMEHLIYTLRGKGGPNCNKVLTWVPTKSGYHLITWPFDFLAFNEKYPDVDVHKNSPTLLYFEWDED